jgi:hypothetical protein
MSSVVFDPNGFVARYPEFSAVSQPLLSAYFAEACLYLSNSDASPVQDIPTRTVLLNMLVAHIGCLAGALGDGQARPVGRVANASKGSVSTALEYAQPGTAAWFQQTQYGASFWQATANFRGFQFVTRWNNVTGFNVTGF